MKSLIGSVAICSLLVLAMSSQGQERNRKGRTARQHDRAQERNVRLNQANVSDSVPMQSTFSPQMKKKKKVAIVPMPPTPPPLGPPVIPPKREP